MATCPFKKASMPYSGTIFHPNSMNSDEFLPDIVIEMCACFAGFEGKQVQVCDPGNVQVCDYGRLQQL
jgi:hypothetical protein